MTSYIYFLKYDRKMQIELKLIFYSILEYNEFYKFRWFLGPTQEHNLDIGTKTKSNLKPGTRTNFIWK
jgi:hypothetical protein